MPDYSKAKIYKIYSYENDDVYYGSTCETLSRRMAGHRRHFKMYKNGKYYYITSFKILELTTAKIELVENYPCNSKEQLLQREGFYIRNNDCINKYIPDRTKKEWVEDNKDKIKEYKKEYYKDNKEQIKEQQKEYNKEYRESNKDKIKEQKKEYRQRKKEQALMFNEDTNIKI